MPYCTKTRSVTEMSSTIYSDTIDKNGTICRPDHMTENQIRTIYAYSCTTGLSTNWFEHSSEAYFFYRTL